MNFNHFKETDIFQETCEPKDHYFSTNNELWIILHKSMFLYNIQWECVMAIYPKNKVYNWMQSN